MLKKSMIAMCLCGATWAGSCQASFFNNSQDLQFLWDINNTGNAVVTATGSKIGASNSQNLSLASETVDDGMAIAVPLPEPEAITSLAVAEPVSESGISSSLSTASGVALAASVAEPGTFYLIALGLMVIGMTAHRRSRV